MTDEELRKYAEDKRAKWEEQMRRFSVLRDSEASFIAAFERERCARLCEAYAMPDGTSETALALAAAIRRLKW